MNVFELRNRVVADYASYVRSFLRIRDEHIRSFVEESLRSGVLWPDPLIQLNPAFEPGAWIDDLVTQGVLHEEAGTVFRVRKEAGHSTGEPMRLHRHQLDAVLAAKTGKNYVLTTGTGSGKSLSYIIPIVDHVLRHGSGKGVQAIVVYPMNALANSQEGELRKFLQHGYAEGRGPVTFARYTGQESQEQRDQILASAPDIILTNYVMLELILTRVREEKLIKQAQNLRFLVLDELHTYRGRQGADVALLVRRVRDRLGAPTMQCVGTSATVAGAGTLDEQRAEVADVASRLFGAPVDPTSVIGETLRRITPATTIESPAFVSVLRERLNDPGRTLHTRFADFVADPLSIWLEATFGVEPEAVTGRLVRAKPKSIRGPEGAVARLSALAGVPTDRCADAIMDGLLGGYRCDGDPATGFPAFAFRLHQFVSRGDSIFSSLETGDERYLSVQGQQFVPGDRQKLLMPLVFCRECGQEYFSVRKSRDPETNRHRFIPRELSDRYEDTSGEPGFLYLSATNPWPDEAAAIVARVPDEWVEDANNTSRVKSDYRKLLPKAVRVGTDGAEGPDGAAAHYVDAPFRFCLNCRVSYGGRSMSDFGKLSELGTAGRSTATTLLSLSAIRYLKRESGLPVQAQKLLSFTDNRQDASLQAGHFNDFVEVGLLRSALHRAVRESGPDGLKHDEVAKRVVAALGLPIEAYALDPEVKYQAKADTQRALERVVGYRLYRDLKRGWRVTLPNLEQTGLLAITYPYLDDICADQEVWQGGHAALVGATPATRKKVAKVLLDYLRRELAIRVDYLDEENWESLRQQSSQYLLSPWAIDEEEEQEQASIVFPRSRRPNERAEHVYLSARTAFGQYLRRSETLPNHTVKITLVETTAMIETLLDVLRKGGLVRVVQEARGPDQVPGYQLSASAMLWREGDGRAPHDPVRVPTRSEEGGQANPFFAVFYRDTAATLAGIEAREHTAQVYHEIREEREGAFRAGKLPLLFCSPTMELGVDIAELNVVGLRNVPPTPANYAQRSGRAGRSGQPALVFTYCAAGSSHDQYFFGRPERMVAGAVAPPRLDLANEDLIRAHIQALWLAEAELNLGKALTDVLEVQGDEPSLALQALVQETLEASGPRERAKARAQRILAGLAAELAESDWYTPTWLDSVLQRIPQSFDRACTRWRDLYRSAHLQHKQQSVIIRDASRSERDKAEAKRIVQEAQAQLRLLTDEGGSEGQSVMQADFYSYRYFASEGFLPGYNFPRLPLSAYIPGRGKKRGRDEFLSRPRFLAISEFGPRGIVYHEGSRYLIHKAILPVGSDDLVTSRAKQCETCGYIHPISQGEGPDMCERCQSPLGEPLRQLFRLQNVSTRRKDRIVSDEEERMRLGYDVATGVRFAEHEGRLACRTAVVERDGAPLAHLTYGHAATLWRINLGWRRRRPEEPPGFVLDVERGYWARNQAVDDDDDRDPMSPKTMRVIPYVEDHRNCLLFEPSALLPGPVMASLQAALKNAIQVAFQLEDTELAAEPLPDKETRGLILFYESAEGGAGVLRQLLDRPAALAEVAAIALDLCHFSPDGADRRRAPRAREDCEAACYDCLMSYGNQYDHSMLDRHLVKDLLLSLVGAVVQSSPTTMPRADFLEHLLGLTDSELERRWLRWLEEGGCRLPSHAQRRIERCKTKPDFLYEECNAAIYIDGPPHDHPDRQQRDAALQTAMEDAGYQVIRFHHQDNWDAIRARHPHVFGNGG